MRTYPNLDESFTIETHTLFTLESIESLLQSTVPLSKVSTALSQRIEDCKDYSFIDFANKHIGGASLSSPCAQEEILFLIYPECCLSMAFAHTMKPNEAIRIRGCSRVANYTGYGHSFHYNTPCETPSDVNEVIAIDAIPYGGSEQFSREAVLRDINKAIVGFQLSSPDRKGIASGKWGCGCFGGDPCLKAMQQWIAASMAHKEVKVNELGKA
jgi:chromosome undetermined scaffold_71, whole genome shotgun sequence